MKQLVKEYFTFNRREQSGILALLGIIISLLLTLVVLKATRPAQHYDFTAFQKEIAELEKARTNNTKGEEKTDRFEVNRDIIAHKSAERFNFNPNGLSEQEWKKLGF